MVPIPAIRVTLAFMLMPGNMKALLGYLQIKSKTFPSIGISQLAFNSDASDAAYRAP
jgi:hypothetical protein